MSVEVFSLSRFGEDLNTSMRSSSNAILNLSVGTFVSAAYGSPLIPLALSAVVTRAVYSTPVSQQGNFLSPTLRLITKVALEAIGILSMAFLNITFCALGGRSRLLVDALSDSLVTSFILRAIDGFRHG